MRWDCGVLFFAQHTLLQWLTNKIWGCLDPPQIWWKSYQVLKKSKSNLAVDGLDLIYWVWFKESIQKADSWKCVNIVSVWRTRIFNLIAALRSWFKCAYVEYQNCILSRKRVQNIQRIYGKSKRHQNQKKSNLLLTYTSEPKFPK